jgi:MtN3 and saliva related transmembrane protein
MSRGSALAAGDILVNAVGVAAAIFSTSSFVPQVMTIICERTATWVSVRMYLVTVASFALWTAYGFLLRSWPLVTSNLVSLGLAGLVLGLKFRYGGASGSVAKASRKRRTSVS